MAAGEPLSKHTATFKQEAATYKTAASQHQPPATGPCLEVGPQRQEAAQAVGEAADNARPLSIGQRVLHLPPELPPVGCRGQDLSPPMRRWGACAGAARPLLATGAARAAAWALRCGGPRRACNRRSAVSCTCGGLLNGRANATFSFRCWLLRLLLRVAAAAHLATRPAGCCRLGGRPTAGSRLAAATPGGHHLEQTPREVCNLSCILGRLLSQPAALIPQRRLLFPQPLHLLLQHICRCSPLSHSCWLPARLAAFLLLLGRLQLLLQLFAARQRLSQRLLACS